MDFKFTPEQEALRKDFEEFCKEEVQECWCKHHCPQDVLDADEAVGYEWVHEYICQAESESSSDEVRVQYGEECFWE